MAVKSKEELYASIKAIMGEDNTDSGIALLEDISDTLTDFESKLSGATDWEAKYYENDKAWREKYVSRFDSGNDVEELVGATMASTDTSIIEAEEAEEITIDDLFE